MYRVLIVDDEMYAVKGVVDGVDWKRMEVLEVYEAYNAQEAQGILREEQIDLMICDIQMPVMNGLSLLEWANAQRPELKTIFLSCHAEFTYAQRAMQLGSRDYMLKPVLYEELEAIIAKNLSALREERHSYTQTETFRKYYQLWHEQKPELIQAFWRDLMNGNKQQRKESMEQAIRAYDLPLTDQNPVLLILLSIEEWKKHLNAFDEELLNYALRKAAEEVIIGDQRGHVIEDELGNMMIILYIQDIRAYAQEKWKARCEAYIAACQTYFYCGASCYIGEVASLTELSLTYHELLEMEYGNLSQRNQVVLYAERTKKNEEAEAISFLHWTDSLESGHMERIEQFRQETDGWIRAQQGRRESLAKVYHGMLQVVYYVLLRKGISPDTLYDQGVTSDLSEVTRSSVHLKQWMDQVIQAVMDLIASGQEAHPSKSVVSQIQSYVRDNLQFEITRDELSAHVHLNPSYLSRIFRIKTGLSLSEYILQERMNRATELLTDTKGSISSIAQSLGYDNFSYFSKMFKKVHQVTPQEFRRNLMA